MISSLFGLLRDKHTYTPTSINTVDYVDKLNKELKTYLSDKEHYKLTIVFDKTLDNPFFMNVGLYTLKARRIKWYEPFTSLFWIDSKDDQRNVAYFIDELAFRNVNLVYDTGLLEQLEKVARSPDTRSLIHERASKIEEIRSKCLSPAQNVPVKKIIVETSQDDSEYFTGFLSIFQNHRQILSYLTPRDLANFQRASKETYLIGQKKLQPISYLKNVIINKEDFDPSRILVNNPLTNEDKDWIYQHSEEVLSVLLRHPNLMNNDVKMAFFKNVVFYLKDKHISILIEQTKDPILKNYLLAPYEFRDKIQQYIEGKIKFSEIGEYNHQVMTRSLISDTVVKKFRDKFLAECQFNKELLAKEVFLSYPDLILDEETISALPSNYLEDIDFVCKIINFNTNFYDLLPESVKCKDEVLLALFAKEGSAQYFLKLPDELKQNSQLVIRLLKVNGRILEFIPKKMITREYVLEAVKQNGHVYSYSIPDEFETDRDILQTAMQNYPHALTFAPFYFKNDLELLRLYVKKILRVNVLLTSQIIGTKDKNLILEAVKKGMFHIDPNDPDIIRAFLDARKDNFQKFVWMPIFEEARLNKTVIKEALIRFPMSYNLFSSVLDGDKNLFDSIFAVRPEIIAYASLQYQNNTKYWLKAIERGVSIKNAPQAIRENDEVINSAIEKNGQNLKFIPNNKKSRALVMKAVMNNGLALKFSPNEFRNDEEIATYALHQNQNAWKFVGRNLKEDKLYLNFLSQFPVFANLK